jgi:hypothetical protein
MEPEGSFLFSQKPAMLLILSQINANPDPHILYIWKP